MFFLGEIRVSEFKRHRGSKNKLHKDKEDKYIKTREIRRNLHTGAESLNTVRGISREARSWINLGSRLKNAAKLAKHVKYLKAILNNSGNQGAY